MTQKDTAQAISDSADQLKKDGNVCFALGAGVGVMGVGSALLLGATCPLCVLIAPGAIGYGALKRWQASQLEKTDSTTAGGNNE